MRVLGMYYKYFLFVNVDLLNLQLDYYIKSL